MASHGMKGILGAMRGRTYTPSAYGSGDQGGSAGGYGVKTGHGAAGGGAGGAGGPGGAPMVSFGYAGAALGFEGGVRGGGVSPPETMPAQYPYPKKKGFDEHASADGSVHDVPGVEGMKFGASPDHGMSQGHACHACGLTTKSGHGLVQHMMARHGARAVAHRFGLSFGASQGEGGVPSQFGTHGTSYTPGVEYKGETEGPEEWKKIESEFDSAKSQIHDVASSYATGDKGGSYT